MPEKQSTQISGIETCLGTIDVFSKLQRKPALAVYTLSKCIDLPSLQWRKSHLLSTKNQQALARSGQEQVVRLQKSTTTGISSCISPMGASQTYSMVKATKTSYTRRGMSAYECIPCRTRTHPFAMGEGFLGAQVMLPKNNSVYHSAQIDEYNQCFSDVFGGVCIS